MNYKWCVCDMDGTLLNSKGLISSRNVAALKKLQRYGVEIIIASGRTDLMMKQYIKQLNVSGLIICCNGAVVKNIDKNEIIYSKTLNKAIADYIIEFFFKNNLNFLLYTHDVVFSNKDNYRAKHFEEINESLPKNQRTPINYFDLDSLNIIGNREIIKILLVENDSNVRDYVANYLENIDNISVVSSANGLLDIWASNISKGSAVKILAEMFEVNLEQVIAFGDNYNDIELLKTAGMPIAMGNAKEQLKTIAKYVTLTNDDDGIAYAVDKYILN